MVNAVAPVQGSRERDIRRGPDHGSTSAGRRARGDRSPDAHSQRVSAPRIQITPQDRVLIFGATGSGKSYLANAIASRWDRVLVFDPKHEDDLPNAAICYGVDAAYRALPGRVVYRPTPIELRDLAARWDRLVEKIFKLGGRHGIKSHETYMLGSANGGFEPFYAAAHTQGRALYIPIVDCTQRPLAMPRVCISEATHYFCFFLSDADDRKTASRYMGEPVRDQTPLSHDFWYCGPDKITRRVPAIA